MTKNLPALSNNQRDVVLLVARAELPNLIDNRGRQGFGGELAMPFEAFNEAWFAELLAFIVGRFGYAIGVERKGIAGNKLPFFDRATPGFEKTKHSSSRFQPFNCRVAECRQRAVNNR